MAYEDIDVMRNDMEKSLMVILLIAMSAIFWAKGYPAMESELEACQIEVSDLNMRISTL